MNKQKSTFEILKFSPYNSENLLLDNNNDPEENVFKESHFADTNSNSLYKIPNYNSIHQTRGNGKTGGGVAMFIHNTLVYTI